MAGTLFVLAGKPPPSGLFNSNKESADELEGLGWAGFRAESINIL